MSDEMSIRPEEEVAKPDSNDPNADPAAVQEETGNKPTQPGQEEIVAGTAEHARVLNKNPNASSYGPEVNVVQPKPESHPAPGEEPEADVENEDPQEEAQ